MLSYASFHKAQMSKFRLSVAASPSRVPAPAFVIVALRQPLPMQTPVKADPSVSTVRRSPIQ